RRHTRSKRDWSSDVCSSDLTAQLALATTLLIAAGLFLKSLVNVTRVDLGVHVVDVVTFSIAPERSGYDSARALLLYGRVEDEVGDRKSTRLNSSHVSISYAV